MLQFVVWFIKRLLSFFCHKGNFLLIFPFLMRLTRKITHITHLLLAHLLMHEHLAIIRHLSSCPSLSPFIPVWFIGSLLLNHLTFFPQFQRLCFVFVSWTSDLSSICGFYFIICCFTPRPSSILGLARSVLIIRLVLTVYQFIFLHSFTWLTYSS